MPEQLLTINQQLEDPNEAIALFGTNDKHLEIIENLLDVKIVSRGQSV